MHLLPIYLVLVDGRAHRYQAPASAAKTMAVALHRGRECYFDVLGVTRQRAARLRAAVNRLIQLLLDRLRSGLPI